ncbi:MAG TPA: DUF1428 domain-containing protein [Terriglobales bacterium]|nr:DUF1428 domain-containing protein [Terriglobales bacterium]
MYVDGYVIPLPKKAVAGYVKMARAAGKMWKEHGALEFRECVGDDLKTPYGTPFTKRMQLKPKETVFFSFVVYKSKAHRNAVNKKVMADPRMHKMMETMNKNMPFDTKRMAYGGFKVMVDL